MIYSLSVDASIIQAKDGEHTQYWTLVTPSDYAHDFIGPHALLFDEFRHAQKIAESSFIEQASYARVVEQIFGENNSADDAARAAGNLIDFASSNGKTTRGKLILSENGEELAPGLRGYLMDDPAQPLRFYMDFEQVDTADKCNTAFKAIRACERHFRKACGRNL